MMVDAYAAGVNAFLATHRVLPIEFWLTGDRPEPWTPADTIGWIKMLAWNLGGNWRRELLRLQLAASLLPLAAFALQVGGARVAGETLVPPGASPHTYEPTPAQLRRLSRARVLVLNGVGLEFWADKVIAAAANPRLIVVRTAAGLPVLAGDADEPGGNPHVWLSPRDAIHQVEAIRDALIRADPADAPAYRANAERYAGELRALDREIRAAVATFRSRKFIAFHPAWAYFARDYGLAEAAVKLGRVALHVHDRPA